MTEIVDWLQTPHGQSAIEMASNARIAGVDALTVASRLERELGLPSSYRSAASLQAELRLKLTARWGATPQWLLTRDGIEQATHPLIRQWRAQTLAELGIQSIADLGCGLGFETESFTQAGIKVRAVERDVETAAIAGLNLHGLEARVDVFDVVEDSEALETLLAEVDAVFVDPARRDQAAARTIDGRTGNRVSDPSDWSPSWEWVCELGESKPKLVAKVAPGIDHDLLPEGTHTTWFAIRGGLAEASVWWPGFGLPAGRSAIALDRFGEMARIDSTHATHNDITNIKKFILDPSPAVTRSGLVTQLAAMTHGSRIDEHLGYLTSAEEPEDSPLFVTYEVIEEMPFHEKAVHHALVACGARDVQISARGYRGDIDALTKSLKRGLTGDKVISILLARVGDSITAILAQRIN
jgi:hypothetical protein